VNTACSSFSSNPTATGVSWSNEEQGLASQRLVRERRTLVAMIECYCRGNHASKERLCPECRSLLDYATVRLERCRFGPAKPTCAKCSVHCYQSVRREQVKQVMRYAGPRMLWQHPVLAFRHWLDGRVRPAIHVRTP
jgi:hypothetical protein